MKKEEYKSSGLYNKSLIDYAIVKYYKSINIDCFKEQVLTKDLFYKYPFIESISNTLLYKTTVKSNYINFKNDIYIEIKSLQDFLLNLNIETSIYSILLKEDIEDINGLEAFADYISRLKNEIIVDLTNLKILQEIAKEREIDFNSYY